MKYYKGYGLLNNVDYLRLRREDLCYNIINRGTAWYNSLTQSQYDELIKWYNEWLNVTDTLIEPTTPAWL